MSIPAAGHVCTDLLLEIAAIFPRGLLALNENQEDLGSTRHDLDAATTYSGRHAQT